MIPEHCRLVFIGTPEFSVPSLEKIIEAGFNVVAVITAPDRPAGRGMKLQASAVKQCAVNHHIPVLQPTNLKNPEFLQTLADLKPDVQVVIAFRMLPEVVWNLPTMGTINLHASLLPDYRGAAPINRAIMNGEKQTGLTTFRLKHVIDTGNILRQLTVDIGANETAGELHDRMMHLGADLMIETLMGVLDHSLVEQPQVVLPHHKNAPKIFKDDCLIDWQQNGNQIINLIRGLSPYPTARCFFQGKILKIYHAEYDPDSAIQIGEVNLKDDRLAFGCADGVIYPTDVQIEGKRRMSVEEMLRGLR
ncbi:MAG: methionyl-tRNA formyltransferase [Flavobacteriales bacterium]|nr:methionyl-tRNA formyltransferase [Bacteroidota bacterium]MCB9239825.1 methionyl-tRNA formyltransferase [Flavobacteriales bacterium]